VTGHWEEEAVRQAHRNAALLAERDELARKVAKLEDALRISEDARGRANSLASATVREMDRLRGWWQGRASDDRT
jgi:hypothetical protein